MNATLTTLDRTPTGVVKLTVESCTIQVAVDVDRCVIGVNLGYPASTQGEISVVPSSGIPLDLTLSNEPINLRYVVKRLISDRLCRSIVVDGEWLLICLDHTIFDIKEATVYWIDRLFRLLADESVIPLILASPIRSSQELGMGVPPGPPRITIYGRPLVGPSQLPDLTVFGQFVTT